MPLRTGYRLPWERLLDAFDREDVGVDADGPQRETQPRVDVQMAGTFRSDQGPDLAANYTTGVGNTAVGWRPITPRGVAARDPGGHPRSPAGPSPRG